MWQTIAVVGLVTVALFFTLRRTVKTATGTGGCACTGCDKKELGCGK